MQLIYKHAQGRHFKITDYPDGQQQVTLDLDYFNDPKEPIDIVCSIRNFYELEVLFCIVGALKEADFIIHQIQFLYLFGLRSDRRFEDGSCNYVRNVIQPLLKLLRLRTVYDHAILIPHGRANAYLQAALIQNACLLPPDFQGMFKIAGDQSAEHIVNDYALLLRQHVPHFNKERRLGTTRSSGMRISLDKQSKELLQATDMPILIMDDLCDGGATFIAEAEYLRDTGVIKPERKINLFVYHGLFSKGFDELFKYFDKIYTTNSYQEFPQNADDPLHISKDKLHVIDVWGN